MEDDKIPRLNYLIERLKVQMELKIELLMLKIAESCGRTIGNVITNLAVLIMVVIGIILISVGAAYLLVPYLGALWKGFLAVAGVYLLLAIVLYLIKDSVIEKPLLNAFTKIILKKEDHGKEED
ncbi:hypothetical protein NF867_17485 [Solitalea sp. MAHUQ-68]|uniref:Phage holin family protein n=1 Tax=Solitalea agri TaxID=2953739 RepID=A0A9X2FD28_9SPHI|nr:hypothetical protein [Solitalea agri]MCO4294658.1 hypothetical protein [Solitalea agri]